MMKARVVPGYTKSNTADEAGLIAGAFVEAVRDGNYPRVWGLLSKESRGLAAGAWIASQGRATYEVYSICRTTSHPEFGPLVQYLCNQLIADWIIPLEELGVAPTKYLDERRALVRLPVGISEPILVTQETAAVTVYIPMQLEDGDWKIHLPGILWLDE